MSEPPTSKLNDPSQTSLASGRLIVCSWVVVLICLAHASWKHYSGSRVTPIQKQVDLNTAPWWELTVLPEIGPAMAHRIVKHRDQAAGLAPNRKVFQSLDDFDAVAGIGPKTLRKLAPLLKLDAAEEVSLQQEEKLSSGPQTAMKDRRNAQKQQN